ncbi:hypothetical protein Hanom_Chr12g01138161 [Helianthus anomalus]
MLVRVRFSEYGFVSSQFSGQQVPDPIQVRFGFLSLGGVARVSYGFGQTQSTRWVDWSNQVNKSAGSGPLTVPVNGSVNSQSLVNNFGSDGRLG